MKPIAISPLLAPLFAGILLLSSGNGMAAMSNEEAQQQVDSMLTAGLSMAEVIVNLLEQRFSLAEATALTLQEVADPEQQQALARTVLCMSRDPGEAEAITRSISAAGSDEQTVALFVNEQVKFNRSSCNAYLVAERPPLTQSGGEARPAIDTSPSR